MPHYFLTYTGSDLLHNKRNALASILAMKDLRQTAHNVSRVYDNTMLSLKQVNMLGRNYTSRATIQIDNNMFKS